ncbi:hypothetical protein ONZ43_g160 [Nemania bipapillata]|uniref:Uncharacterized protein n=1 Tax=Nemania bipapillata TaxID=110536 RepID=A0ACC2J9M4_9PEZI|nr:hypothetical protein ONZ43_g160 [Nemania bipapillata]
MATAEPEHMNDAGLIQGCYVWSIGNSFNEMSVPLGVDSDILPFQTWILSLTPRSRVFDTPFDPSEMGHPVITWISEQAPYINFSKPGEGPRLMHLHASGSPSVDITKVSRLFYKYYDCPKTGLVKQRFGLNRKHGIENSVVYFEFDKWDSRYNTISSMLTYLINDLIWRFQYEIAEQLTNELELLKSTQSWSLEDLYNLYSKLRSDKFHLSKLTFFIGSFDQCPKDQQQWFLQRVMEEKTWSDERYPHHPVYEDYRSQIDAMLDECYDAPPLGHSILTWLEEHGRRQSKHRIEDMITKLSPVTAENTIRVFISALVPKLRSRAERIFNWVKHASEPWSPESLSQALRVYESRSEEHFLDDISPDDIIREIDVAFGGIIMVKNGDIKFSHSSFYSLPEIGIEGDVKEWAARTHSTIAEACLRYFQLNVAQETLRVFCQQNLEGALWSTPLDAIVISHSKTSMAEYAVRFWHQHYKASGDFKPRQLVQEVLSNRECRAAWEVPFWLLSNPFTRIQRSYISTLPILAMLGLDDLVEEKVKYENGLPSFQKNCWFAITEGARAGNRELVQYLLGLVEVDEDELRTALFWAAANGGDANDIVNLLVAKIPNPKTFAWPENIIFRAAASGLNGLLQTMLESGCDVNTIGRYPGQSSLGEIAALRNQVSTIEVLLSSEPRLDMSVKRGHYTVPVIEAAIRNGNPRIIEPLLRFHGNHDPDLLREATRQGKHKAVELLIQAGIDVKANEGKSPAICSAIYNGYRECTRLLLENGADANATDGPQSLLSIAVWRNHVEVARLLLEHEPKPVMATARERGDILLIPAIKTGNSELVSLLLKHNAEINVVCPINDTTPLSQACRQGNLEIVKLLLDHKAGINYTGGLYRSPLVNCIYGRDDDEVADYLLQYEDIDLKWTDYKGRGILYVVSDRPNMIRKLIKRGASIDALGSPLHHVSRYNQPESLEALLESDPKPDVDCVCQIADRGENVGYTPLLLACKYRNPKCLKLLLEAGANPNLKNKKGHDGVDILLGQKRKPEEAEECLRLLLARRDSVPLHHVDEKGRTRLHKIHEKSPVSLVRLLVEANVPLDIADHDGYTPLTLAVSQGNKDVVKYLIGQGARVNIRNPIFVNIVYLAVAMEFLDPKVGAEVLKLLVRRGAEVDGADGEGRHPVHIACKSPDASGLKVLADAGARLDVRDNFGHNVKDLDINVKDNDGWTPLMWAVRSGSRDTVTTLISRGADLSALGFIYFSDMMCMKWPALKLAYFAGLDRKVVADLKPKEQMKFDQDSKEGGCDDNLQVIGIGHQKLEECMSCFVVSISPLSIPNPMNAYI